MRKNPSEMKRKTQQLVEREKTKYEKPTRIQQKEKGKKLIQNKGRKRKPFRLWLNDLEPCFSRFFFFVFKDPQDRIKVGDITELFSRHSWFCHGIVTIIENKIYRIHRHTHSSLIYTVQQHTRIERPRRGMRATELCHTSSIKFLCSIFEVLSPIIIKNKKKTLWFIVIIIIFSFLFFAIGFFFLFSTCQIFFLLSEWRGKTNNSHAQTIQLYYNNNNNMRRWNWTSAPLRRFHPRLPTLTGWSLRKRASSAIALLLEFFLRRLAQDFLHNWTVELGPKDIRNERRTIYPHNRKFCHAQSFDPNIIIIHSLFCIGCHLNYNSTTTIFALEIFFVCFFSFLNFCSRFFKCACVWFGLKWFGRTLFRDTSVTTSYTWTRLRIQAFGESSLATCS